MATKGSHKTHKEEIVTSNKALHKASFMHKESRFSITSLFSWIRSTFNMLVYIYNATFLTALEYSLGAPSKSSVN